MKLIIDEEVKELINHICDIQIKALLNIQQGIYQMDEEDVELITQFQASIQDIKREAQFTIIHFRDMKSEPLLIGITSNRFLSIMRHILFRIEEEYANKPAIAKLWDIFFYIERERTPEIKLMVKSKNHGKKEINTNRTGIKQNNKI